MEGEKFLKIRVQGQNGLHNTKLKVFLSILQILEVSRELLRDAGRSTLEEPITDHKAQMIILTIKPIQGAVLC